MRTFKSTVMVFVPVLLILSGCLGGTLPSHVRPVKVPGNVAFQARATASSTYTDPFLNLSFESAAAVDGITFESHQPETFWLLPNGTNGFLSIEPNGLVRIDEIRILNTHNSGFNDRGTKDFRVDAIDRDGKTTTIWRDRFSRMGESKRKSFPGIIANRIIVHVDSYFHAGGGLNEVEVIGKKVAMPIAATAVPSPPPSPRSEKPSFPQEPVFASFPKASERPEDIAVIIGNADYSRGKDIPNVNPAHADAESFKRFAMAALGIREGNIIDLRDATGTEMISVFGSDRSHKGRLFNWTRTGVSNVYVYFAGHGAPAGSDGSAYLVPADADAATIELTGYRLETLYANLTKLQARSVTVVLEACFSGASQAGSVIPRASGIYAKPKTPRVPTNLTVIAAGGANEIASWEEDGSHGLFTKYYLTGMSGEADQPPYGNGDGTVGTGELKTYLDHTLTYFARRYYGRDQTARIIIGRGK
ncbi:MAG: caspase family protein [Alphaproteobacteria bacterium]|nr:caspase family protein [Alphaproteobacteria bacterium]